MIDVFDPRQAYLLKEDELLINGLVTHLGPTLIRISGGLPIENALLDEEKKHYADIFEKVIPAANLLSSLTDTVIPEEEIGLLAFHFGGAIYRLQSEKRKPRTVRIGVVCMGGIGISILMASKLRHHFGTKIETVTLQADQVSGASIDFLVSSFSFDTEHVLYAADPLLPEEQLLEIEKYVNSYAHRPLPEEKVSHEPNISAEAEPLTSGYQTIDVEKIHHLTGEILSLRRNFACIYLNADISFFDAIKQISSILGNEDTSPIIEQDFLEREKKSSQIIQPLELVFLHAKSKGTKYSKVMIALSDDVCFHHESLKGCKVFIIMLLSSNQNTETTLLSNISNEIFEDDEYLDAIYHGNEQEIRMRINRSLDTHLKQAIQKLMNKE